jgi:hypothetical protein
MRMLPTRSATNGVWATRELRFNQAEDDEQVA